VAWSARRSFNYLRSEPGPVHGLNCGTQALNSTSLLALSDCRGPLVPGRFRTRRSTPRPCRPAKRHCPWTSRRRGPHFRRKRAQAEQRKHQRPTQSFLSAAVHPMVSIRACDLPAKHSISARSRRLSLTYPLPSADVAPDERSYPPGLGGRFARWRRCGVSDGFVQIIRSEPVTSPVDARRI
jgi:hypothetical protein